MPLYEYQCEACGHRFEVIQKYSDAAISVCPKCGGAVRKLFSSPAIQFKGSGFYITDYARAGKSVGGGAAAENGESTSESKPAAAESKSEAKAETKDTAKSESKSAKTESKADAKSPNASKPASD